MKNKIRTYSCIGCGEVVTKSCVKKIKFCTQECYHKHFREHGGKRSGQRNGVYKKCKGCNSVFYVTNTRRGKAICCSVKCHNLYQSRNKINLICKVCKKSFDISPSFIKQNRKYCSKECRYNDPDEKMRLLSIRTSQMGDSPNRFEKEVYGMLDALGINYIPQYIINNKFTVDAYLPGENIVIQFDGDYWHGNNLLYKTLDKRQQKRKALDISQNAYLRKAGIGIFRFWQSDFKNNINDIINKLSNL